MVTTTYHCTNFVRHAGHLVRAHPVCLPQTGHFIFMAKMCELKMTLRLQRVYHIKTGNNAQRVIVDEADPGPFKLTVAQSGQ